MASQELARSAEPSDAGGAVARRRLDAAHFARVEASRKCAPSGFTREARHAPDDPRAM